jgi:hypothetical protein
MMVVSLGSVWCRRANNVGTLATKAAAKASTEPHVLRFTWLVPFPYIGRRTMAMAMSKKPMENKPIRERRLKMISE